MKRMYDFNNILEQYDLDDINELFTYLKSNSKRLNLSHVNLSHVNLSHVNLEGANLSYANLEGADLFNTNLIGANLIGANLIDANLTCANLSYANLEGANLSGADLDFSCLVLSCKTLSTKFDQRHIVQFLYHAAMPAQNNKLALDDDIIELFESDLFKKIVNKFHRVGDECHEFEGVNK